MSIADVCALLPLDSALDIEARERGTTFYMPHKRLDMLPSLLSSDICSLHANVDRLAVTVFWKFRVTDRKGRNVNQYADYLKLDKDGDIVFTLLDDGSCCVDNICRTIIRSVAALTYEQGDRLVSGLDPGGLPLPIPSLKPTSISSTPQNAHSYSNSHSNDHSETATGSTSISPDRTLEAGYDVADKALYPKLRDDLRLLTVFSRYLGRRRTKMGALDLQGVHTQLKFAISDRSRPEEGLVEPPDHLEIHDTIAELMVYANESVAKTIHTFSPDEAFLRIHGKQIKRTSNEAKMLAFVFCVSFAIVLLIDCILIYPFGQLTSGSNISL